MLYHWKLFLWENGAKSTDYTKHLIVPIFIEDNLDETLDSGEVVLKSMPISSREAFSPKTKFRIERYLTKELADTPKTWDMVVEHDDVEEYVGAPTICTHRIHLIEPSVIAQGMHVDNIALTYELQDVKLNYKTIKEDETLVNENFTDPEPTPKICTTTKRQTDLTLMPEHPMLPPGYNPPGTRVSTETTTYFRNSYQYKWDSTSLNAIKGLRAALNAGQTNDISFTVPKLTCQGSYDNNTFVDLFEMNTKTTVTKTKYKGNEIVSSETIIEKVSGSSIFTIKDDEVCSCNSTTASLRLIDDWGITAKPGNLDTWGKFHYEERFSSNGGQWIKSPVATAQSSYRDKEIKFTTEQLSGEDMENGYTIKYNIKCITNSPYPDNMLSYYEKKCYKRWESDGTPGGDTGTALVSTTVEDSVNASTIKLEAEFVCLNQYLDVDGGYFLKKGKKYSCYNLLRKAFLTTDTQIFDPNIMGLDTEPGIEYPIALNPTNINLNNRLKKTKVNETIFEVKNLWEVLLQIGYYLHAIPYLEFAKDGTDRFWLDFKQLGDKKIKEDTSRKITIFNSKNLSEYFTQFDCYVSNMFSPQNIAEEWLVPKTSSSSYIVDNENAELHTSFPISEITEFDIAYDGSSGGNADELSALQYIFEQCIYQITPNDDPTKNVPVKGNSLYYTLGSNKILGLNFVAPKASTGEFLFALKEICRRLFGKGTEFKAEDLTFNALKFHIKYRTQDSLRLSQFRPDIQNFMKNSSYEKYPHHEQFYGQQDKIVDSERFSANLWGRLVRVGNAIYQRQEYSTAANEKESGDLVEFNDGAYYVTAVENEYYTDTILQKVTYSKNFNQLSNIVTIPSEPRFYEVSERSKICREVRLNDFLLLSNEPPSGMKAPKFLNQNTWKEFVKTLLFSKSATLPNFAYTKYIVDKKRDETNKFPSSEMEKGGANGIVKPKEAKDYADCTVPLMHFPMQNGLVFEWNMEDNFKAGDFVCEPIYNGNNLVGNSQLMLQPLRYVDYMGRADLFQFKLFHRSKETLNEMSFDEARQLPKAVKIPTEHESQMMSPSGKVIGLDKDNREALSFNYQINLLHKTKYGDDFVTFPNLFGNKDSELRMCFLNEKIGIFDETVRMSENIVADNVQYAVDITGMANAIKINITKPIGVDLSKVNSIVLYQVDETNGRYVYIAKNLDKVIDDEKLNSWFIYPTFND